MHRCKSCIQGVDPALHSRLVRNESDAYLQRISTQQQWSDEERAFQLLFFAPQDSPPLPAYKPDPEFLDPSHCRLCLEAVSQDDLVSHLKTNHQITSFHEYRQVVFLRTIAEWPQQISPQVLRSRLAAFKKELCDANFKEEACACCARLKRICKLRPVAFPPVSTASPPCWLPWDDEAWEKYREKWFDQVNELLNTNNYLTRFFRVDEKLRAATEGVRRFTDPTHIMLGVNDTSTFTSITGAEAWLRRVQTYVANLQRNLTADSVPAPGRDGDRWMLYRSPTMDITGNGTINCHLCRRCYECFRRTTGQKQTPSLIMPGEARANGLWRGPDPPELAALSYNEAKVINLARVYVSVKRVFLNRSSYARTSATEAPMYHQKNVVAYPQNPDAALRSLGMSPKNLAKMVVVQFVGEDLQSMRHDRDLRFK